MSEGFKHWHNGAPVVNLTYTGNFSYWHNGAPVIQLAIQTPEGPSIISGSAVGDCVVTGSVEIPYSSISGTTAGTATVSGTLIGMADLTGSATGDCVVSGDLGLTIYGSATGDCVVSGTIGGDGNLEGHITPCDECGGGADSWKLRRVSPRYSRVHRVTF